MFALKIPIAIRRSAKLLAVISPKLATRFAVKLFISPLRHDIPKRELDYDRKTTHQRIYIDAIQKEIEVYVYGSGSQTILISHGWSGRGTQLFKIAERLTKMGFRVVSFDGPSHGRSTGKTTLMIEFIASILQLQKEFGGFYSAVGHSLGGMSILNAAVRGLEVEKLVTIGAGDVIYDIILDFVKQLGLDESYAKRMQNYFEKKYQMKMHDLSASVAAAGVKQPTLIVHDKQDDDVPVTCAYAIAEKLENGTLLITERLGHRKILGDADVISQIADFLRIDN
ncbi:alpha/beta hydrolase [Flavobacterium aurantiibacter]|uniref:Alpha/beta hydrolase n=1 Tax=Flavobacterium aurantiibacter TaxID=2023067 RepID=A0A255ZLS5_9FLAO|nr:alpha/beta hydrolase [Flavobacterium aurantiibacter]